MKKMVFFIVLCLYTAFGQQLRYSESPEQFTADPDTAIAFHRGEIEGFTTSPSVTAGGTVQFKVSVLSAYNPANGAITSQGCTMSIYRVKGLTMNDDELVTSGYTFNATFYPLRDKNGDSIYPGQTDRFPWDYRWGCNHWQTGTTISTNGSWKSGFYYAKIVVTNNPSKIGYIPFVVKPASSAQKADILCAINWNTYQAYNYWGGGCLYWWLGMFESPDIIQNDPKKRGEHYIRTVSFRRPFVDFPNSAGAPTDQLGKVNLRERKFIAWAEANGYIMDFCIDGDIHANPLNFISKYKQIVFSGHSEYWSRQQRSNIEITFKQSGGNLTFHCANNCYWMVNYYPISSSNPDSMVCEKDNDSAFWRIQPLISGVGESEAKFIGNQFYGTNQPGGPNTASIVQLQNHWVFRETNLINGSQFGKGDSNAGLEQLSSGEADMFRSGISPINTDILGRVFIRNLQLGETHYNELQDHKLYSDVTYYEDTGTNSRVFASGGHGFNSTLYGTDASTMSIISKNLLDHFSGKKYIGNIYTTFNNGPLTWRSSITLDGNVTVLTGKYLRIDADSVKIDSTLFVDGTVEINGNVTFYGDGSFNLNPSGRLLLKSGSTLNVNSYFVLENGTNQITFESSSKLVINNASIENGATLSVDSLGTLEVKPGAQVLFGLGEQSFFFR